MTPRRTFLAFLIAFAAVSFAGLTGCSSHPPPWKGKGGPPRVVVSIPPLASFVEKVGGDHVGVLCICTTHGPHQYDYNAQDALAVREADLLLGIGLGLDEKFMDKLQSNSGNPKLKYVKLGDALRSKALLKKLDDGEDDPHVWLGVDTAKELVNAIADELKAVDPANAASYEKNAKVYCEKLTALRDDFRADLKGKVVEKILPTHDSLQYFGESFGVPITEALEKNPGESPGPEWYAKLPELCTDAKEPDAKKRTPIRLIATEPQYEKKDAETLRTELKKKDIEAVLLEIDPLETANANELNADWYETKMKANLALILKNLKDKN